MTAVGDQPPVEIEPWELHSELVLVSPEVCRRALELMPDRDPDAFLARRRASIAPATMPSQEEPGLTPLVLRYTLGRIGHSARFALGLALGSVGLALIAELLH